MVELPLCCVIVVVKTDDIVVRQKKRKKEKKKPPIEGDGDVVDKIAVLVKVVSVRRTWRYRGSICIA